MTISSSLTKSAGIYYRILYLNPFGMNFIGILNGFKMNMQKANSLSIMLMQVVKTVLQ